MTHPHRTLLRVSALLLLAGCVADPDIQGKGDDGDTPDTDEASETDVGADTDPPADTDIPDTDPLHTDLPDTDPPDETGPVVDSSDTDLPEDPFWYCRREGAELGTVLIHAIVVFVGEECVHDGLFAMDATYWAGENFCVGGAYDDVSAVRVGDDGSEWIFPYRRGDYLPDDPFFRRGPGEPTPPSVDRSGFDPWTVRCSEEWPELPWGP